MIDPNDPLPSGERITPQDRAQRFLEQRVTPAANPDYALRLLVPRAWEPLVLPGADQPVSATRLTPLGGWQDPAYATAPALFHVQAIGLPRELTAEHFLIAYANEQNLKILALHGITDVVADALVAQTIKGEPYIVRMTTSFDGDRAYVAMGLAHRSDYGAYADVFGAMIGSIRIERLVGRPHVEERVTRTLLDAIAFEAPISFRALQVPEGTETHRALDLFERDPGGDLTGLIRLDLELERRDPSVEDELVYVAAHLMKRGITLGKEPQEIPVDSSEESAIRLRSMHRVSGMANDRSPLEIWIGLFHARGAALRVWMVSPAREAKFREWAVNQRGLRVVLSTLRAA